MKVFVVVGEYETCGVFKDSISAESRIKELHDTGYFGCLQISEDELED
jgi:Tfp pilus assembly protein PilO